MERVSAKAFAKVNLTLHVKKKLPDGYHQLETLFRGVFLHDLLTFTGRGDGIALTLSGPFGDSVPPGGDNLACQAAELLRAAFPGRIRGVEIHLEKHIPTQAGLGGGSADAAATLLGLDRLFDLRLEGSELRRLAACLGADVAFCLEPLAALGRGRGDLLEPLDPGKCGAPMWILLVKPPFGLATKEVYGAWRPGEHDADAGGPGSRDSLDSSTASARLGALLQALASGDTPSVWKNLFNDLEEPAFLRRQSLVGYKRWIETVAAALAAANPGSSGAQSGAPPVSHPVALCSQALLCGSGSAFAVFFASEAPALLLLDRLQSSLHGRPRAGPPCRDGAEAPEAPEAPPLLLLTKTLSPADLGDRFREKRRGE